MMRRFYLVVVWVMRVSMARCSFAVPRSGALLLALMASQLVFASGGAVADSLFGVPKSDLVIEGEIQTPEGRTISFFAREGTIVTVQDLRTGKKYGFQSYFGNDGILKVRPWEVVWAWVPDGMGQSLEESGVSLPVIRYETNWRSARQGVDWPVNIQTDDGVFKLRIDNAAEYWSFGDADLLDSLLYPEPDPEGLNMHFGLLSMCCVTCDGVTVCGTSVSINDCEASASCGGGGRYLQH